MDETRYDLEEPCACCGGSGWLLVNLESRGDLAIQTCDSCQVFSTDNEALLRVVDLASRR